MPTRLSRSHTRHRGALAVASAPPGGHRRTSRDLERTTVRHSCDANAAAFPISPRTESRSDCCASPESCFRLKKDVSVDKREPTRSRRHRHRPKLAWNGRRSCISCSTASSFIGNKVANPVIFLVVVVSKVVSEVGYLVLVSFGGSGYNGLRQASGSRAAFSGVAAVFRVDRIITPIDRVPTELTNDATRSSRGLGSGRDKPPIERFWPQVLTNVTRKSDRLPVLGRKM
jgi:hypothetical protein